MTLFSLTLILFLIMDPLGNIASFNTTLSHVDTKRRNFVLFREMVIALLAMMTFNVLGEALFNFLEVTATSVYFSSGLILFLFAIRILFPSLRNPRMNLPKEEPFIIPLAIPLIASPSLLATVMLFAHEEHAFLLFTAIIIAWSISTVIMFFAPQLEKILGPNGINAIERLMAMILVMISIQRFLEGMQLFLATHPKSA